MIWILRFAQYDKVFVLFVLDCFALLPQGLAMTTFIFLSSSDSCGSILDEKSGLCSHEQGNKAKSPIDEASGKLPDLSLKDNALFYNPRQRYTNAVIFTSLLAFKLSSKMILLPDERTVNLF